MVELFGSVFGFDVVYRDYLEGVEFEYALVVVNFTVEFCLCV